MPSLLKIFHLISDNKQKAWQKIGESTVKNAWQGVEADRWIEPPLCLEFHPRRVRHSKICTSWMFLLMFYVWQMSEARLQESCSWAGEESGAAGWGESEDRGVLHCHGSSVYDRTGAPGAQQELTGTVIAEGEPRRFLTSQGRTSQQVLWLVTAQECPGAATPAKHPGHALVTEYSPMTPCVPWHLMHAINHHSLVSVRWHGEHRAEHTLTFQHPRRRSAQRAGNSSVPSQTKVFMNHC